MESHLSTVERKKVLKDTIESTQNRLGGKRRTNGNFSGAKQLQKVGKSTEDRHGIAENMMMRGKGMF